MFMISVSLATVQSSLPVLTSHLRTDLSFPAEITNLLSGEYTTDITRSLCPMDSFLISLPVAMFHWRMNPSEWPVTSVLPSSVKHRAVADDDPFPSSLRNLPAGKSQT